MTIKVAKDGYAGSHMPGGGFLLINGVLHQRIQPTNSRDDLYIPVRSYDGPVEHVDTRGKPVSASTTEVVNRG